MVRADQNAYSELEAQYNRLELLKMLYRRENSGFCRSLFSMGGMGIEPTITGPQPAVLPLHHSHHETRLSYSKKASDKTKPSIAASITSSHPLYSSALR